MKMVEYYEQELKKMKIEILETIINKCEKFCVGENRKHTFKSPMWICKIHSHYGFFFDTIQYDEDSKLVYLYTESKTNVPPAVYSDTDTIDSLLRLLEFVEDVLS